MAASRPHRANGWWLCLLTRPRASVDGHETSCSWSREVSVDVDPGTVKIETFVRYRGTSAPLGVGRLRVTVAPGQTVRVLARDGLANGTPFRPSATS